MEHDTARAIYQAGFKLFARQGWIKTRTEQICAEAGISRVTFYKYHSNKKALLRQILSDDKDRVRQALLHGQQHAQNMAQILNILFEQQKLSLAGIYTPALLNDIAHHRDAEMAVFFRQMDEEKYAFMSRFFQTLQQRGLIRSSARTALIDAFVRQLDALLQQHQVQQAYEDAPQDLRQDALQLLLCGLAGQYEQNGGNADPAA